MPVVEVVPAARARVVDGGRDLDAGVALAPGPAAKPELNTLVQVAASAGAAAASTAASDARRPARPASRGRPSGACGQCGRRLGRACGVTVGRREAAGSVDRPCRPPSSSRAAPHLASAARGPRRLRRRHRLRRHGERGGVPRDPVRADRPGRRHRPRRARRASRPTTCWWAPTAARASTRTTPTPAASSATPAASAPTRSWCCGSTPRRSRPTSSPSPATSTSRSPAPARRSASTPPTPTARRR